MANTELRARLSKIITGLVLAHMVLVAGNAFAHEKMGTLYFVVDHLPIIVLFTIVPVIAAFLIEKEKARQGNMVLQGTIGAAWCYNIYDRFLSMPAPVLRPVPLFWTIVYEGSFGVLLIVEVLLMWYGIKLFRELHTVESAQ
jgi:hypothetical protein